MTDYSEVLNLQATICAYNASLARIDALQKELAEKMDEARKLTFVLEINRDDMACCLNNNVELEARAESAEARNAALTSALRKAAEVIDKFMGARFFNEAVSYGGWRITGKGSLNEAFGTARTARAEILALIEPAKETEK